MESIWNSVALCSKAVSIKLKERFGVSATFPHVVSRHTHIVLQWWSPARIFRSIYPVYCRWYQDFLIFTDGMSWRWRPICLVALWANFKYKSAINFHWRTFLNKKNFLDMKTHYLAIFTLKNAPKYHLLSTKWHISSIIKPRQPIRRSIWSYWSHIWHLA